MSARMPYTRWERDRGGKLVLRQATYRVVGRPYLLERGMAMRDAALVALGAAASLVTVLAVAVVIVVGFSGCASADGYDSPPGSSTSPEAHATYSAQPQGWCCDAWDQDGKRYLECGQQTRPEHESVPGDTCYCHGVVSGDECGDASPWTPGSFCMQSDLVCWEAE